MNETRGCWYIYDGRVWRPDIHGLKSAEMAKRFYELLLEFANSITVEDTRNRFLERVNKLDQKKFRDIMVKDASATSEITVRMSALDQNKHLFNCHNGTINLKTGEFKPHSPSDHLTKITEVEGFQLYQAEGLKMPDSVAKATLNYRLQSDRITMFTTQRLKREMGKELTGCEIYAKYKAWCGDNGFKHENISNFRRKMETAGYVYQRRRPWNEKETNPLTMVNDVTWATGDEASHDSSTTTFTEVTEETAPFSF